MNRPPPQTPTPRKQRSFGTKLSANSPLPPRYAGRKRNSSSSAVASAAAGRFAEEAVDASAAEGGTPNRTPLAELLAFGDAPRDSFEIYEATPQSIDSTSPLAERRVGDGEARWTEGAATAGPRREEGSFLYSALEATSPSFRRAAARDARPKNSPKSYPARQSRRADSGRDDSATRDSDGSKGGAATAPSPEVASPDSAATAVPLASAALLSGRPPYEFPASSPVGSVVSASARASASASRSSASMQSRRKSQFTQRTVRNVRSGKRIETAMDVESMERELWSWVETPTKAEEDRVGREVRRRFDARKEGRTAGPSAAAHAHSVDASSFATPIKRAPSPVFSPSSVKKMSRSPTPLKPARTDRWIDPEASTAKKGNSRRSATPSGSKRLREIGQALVGGNGAGFERVLRLKKEVLKELHDVRLALIEEHAAKRQGRRPAPAESRSAHSRENSPRNDPEVAETEDGLPPVSREMLLRQAAQLQRRLGSDGQFAERFADMQMMLREEIAKSSSLRNEVQRRSEEEAAAVKELQQKLFRAYEAARLSEKEYEEKLSEKDGQLATVQSKLESEISAMKADLDLAAERIAEKEKSLDEERSHAKTVRAYLEEAQHSKTLQAKLISTLEEEMDRKQRLMEETEASSDLKTEELNRLRSKIEELELRDGNHAENAEKAQAETAEAVKKWTEREAELLSAIEQQRQDFDTERSGFQQREDSLKVELQTMESLVEHEKVKAADAIDVLEKRVGELEVERGEAFHDLEGAELSISEKEAALNDAADKIAVLEKRVGELEVERGEAFQELEGAKLSISEKEAALNALQSGKNQRISELEAERDSALNELDEARSSLSAREAAIVQEKGNYESRINDLSKLLERQSSVQAGQNEMVKELQAKILRQTEAIDQKDQLIGEMNDEIQTLHNSAEEQNAIKSVLAENLSKHIAASEEGFIKLDELSSMVESKINDFSGRVAKSQADCNAAAESFKCNEVELQSKCEALSRELADKEATLQTAATKSDELESKVVEVATELEKSLTREQTTAKQLEAAKMELGKQAETLKIALLTREELRSKIDELTSLTESQQAESLQRIGELEAQRDGALRDVDDTRAALATAESLRIQLSEHISQVEIERNNALHKLKEANASFTAKESAMRQENEKLDSCIVDLTTQIKHLSSTKERQDERIQEMKEEIQKHKESAGEQATVKSVLIDNLCKLITASEDEFAKLNELNITVESKLKGFSDRVAKSKFDCDAAAESFKRQETQLRSQLAEKEASLESAMAKSTELEKRIVTMNNEFESALAREQCVARQLDEARKELRSQAEAIDKAFWTHEQLEVKNDELTSLVESLEAERSELIGHIQMLELEISECNVSFKSQEAKLESMSSALEENHFALSKLNSEKQQLESMLSAKKKASSNDKELLRDELNRQKESASKEMAKNNELLTKTKLLSSDLEEKEGSFALSRTEFDSVLRHKNDEAAQLKRKIHYTSNELSLLKDELATAQSEISCSRYYEAELKSLHFIESLSLNKAKSNLENSNASLQEKLLLLDAKYNGISDKLKTALVSLEDKKAKMTHLVSELDVMRAEATNLSCQVKSVKEERNTSKELLAQMTAELSSLREQVTERDDQLGDLRTKLSELTSEKSALDCALSSANDKMEAMALKHQISLQDLNGELETTRAEASTTVAELKSNLVTAEQLLDQGDADVRSLSAECERLEIQVQDLSYALKEQKECKTSEVALASAIADRDDIRSRLHAACSELSFNATEVKELNVRIQSLNEQLCLCKDAAAIERCRLEADKAELSETISSLKLSLSETNASQSDLITSIADFQGKLKTKETETSQLRAKIAELGEKVEDLSIQLNQSKRDVVTLELVKNEHLQEINLLQSTNASLSSKISHIESQAQKDNDLFNASKQVLVRDIESKANQVAVLTSQKQELMITIEKLQTVLHSAKSRASGLIAEKDKLAERVSVLTNQVQVLELQSEEDVADFKSQQTRLQLELQEALMSKEEEVSTLITTVGSLKKEMEDLKQQHIATEDSLRCQLLESLEAREIDASESTSQQLELASRMEEHLDSIRAKEIEISSLNAQKEDLDRMIDELTSRIQQSDDKMMIDKNASETREALLLESLNSMEADVSRLTAERDKSQSELSKQESFIASQISRNKELECAVEGLANQIQSLNDQLHSHQRSFDNAQEEYLAISAAKDREIKELRQKQVEMSKALEATEQRLTNHRVELVESIKEKERITKQSQIERERRRQALSDKEVLVLDLASKKEELESQVEDLRNHFRTLKDELQSTHRLFDDAQEEKDQEIQQLTQRLKDLSTELECAYQQLKVETEKVDSHQAKHAESISEKDARISALLSEKNDLKAMAGRLRTQIRQIEEQSQQDRKSSDSKLFAMQSQEQDLKSTVKNLEHQVFQLESQSQLDREASESDRRQMLRDLGNLRNTIEADKIKYSHLKEVLETAKSTVSLKETEIKGLVAEKESAVSEASHREAELNTIIEELQRNLDAKRAVHADLSSRFDDLTSTLHIKNEEISLIREEGKSSHDSLESKLIESQQNLLLHQQLFVKNESALNEKIDSLMREVALIKQEEQDLRKTLEVTREELSAAIDSNHDLEKRHEKVSSECRNANRLLAAIKSELQSCQEELTREKTSHQMDLSSKEELRLKLQEAIKWSDSLRSDINAKEVSLREKDREITSLYEDIESMKSNFEGSISDIHDEHQAFIELQRDDARAEISSLRSELRACKEELTKERTASQGCSDKMNELRLNLEEAIDWSDSLSNDIKEKEHEITSLKEEIKAIKSSSEESVSHLHAEHEAQRNDAQIKLSAVTTELQSCKEALEKERKSHQDGIAKVEELSVKLQEVNDWSDSLRKDVDNYKELLCEKEVEVKHLLSEFESTKASHEVKISETKMEYESTMKVQQEKAQREMSILQSQLQSCQDKLSSSQHTHQQDQVKIEELRLNLSKMEESLNEKQSEISSLSANLESLNAATDAQRNATQNELSLLMSELQSCREMLVNERNHHEDDQAEMENLRTKLQEAVCCSNSLRRDLDQKEKSLDEKEVAILSLSAKIESIKSSSESTISQLNAEHRSAQLQFDEVQKDLASVRSELHETRNQLSNTTTELNSCQEELSIAKSSRQEDQAKIEESRLELEETMGSCELLRSKLDENEKLLIEKESSNKLLAAEIQSIKSSSETTISQLMIEHQSSAQLLRNEAQMEILSIKSELHACENDLARERSFNHENLVKMDDLRSKLDEATDSCESLRSKLAEKDKLLRENEGRIKTLEVEIQSMKSLKATEAQNELSTVKSELQTCQHELASEQSSHLEDLVKMEDLRLKLEASIKRCSELKAGICEKEESLSEKEKEIKALLANMETAQSSHQLSIVQMKAEHDSSMEMRRYEAHQTKSELQKYLEEVTDLRPKLKAATECNDSLRMDLDQKETSLVEKSKELAILVENLASTKASSHEKIILLDNECKSNKEHLMVAQNELASLRSELQWCQEDLASEKASHHEVSAAAEELLRRLQETIGNSDFLKAILAEKERLLCDKDSEITSLKTNIESLKASSQAARALFDEERKSNSELLHKAQGELSTISSELQACREELAIEKASNQKDTAAMKELRISLGEKEQLIREKSQELVQVSESIQFVEKNYSVVQAQMKDILEVLNVVDTTHNDDIVSMVSKLQSSEEELTKKHVEIKSCYNEVVDKNQSLRADMENKVGTLHAMLHSTHRNICQLSKELSRTRSAAVSCIADVKKGLESAIADIVQYYECKSANYQSIITELNQMVTTQQSSLAHHSEFQDEVTTLLSKQQSSTISELSSKLECKNATIERLTNDLIIIRDELVSARAEASCSKEIFKSYHSERVLLHHEIRHIFNDSSTTSDTDDDGDTSLHPYERFLSFVECELRDLIILQNANTVDEDCFTSKPQLIKSLLQSIKLSALSIEPKPVDPNQTSDSQQIRHILSDIDVAKHQVVSMSNKLECAAESREYFEKALIVEQERTSLLEQVISEKSADLEAKTKLLSQTQDQHRRLQSKYVNAEAEIESCQKLAVELKKIIVQKNAEIQSMEGTIFDLQFKLDDITARSHGMMASFDGFDDTELDFFGAETKTTDRMNASALRHIQLTDQVSKLEETILRMNQDAAQQTSMHQALVDGLEAECQRLTDEIVEARDYIYSLENMQSSLEGNIVSLKKDNAAKTRVNMDLESALTILKQQKASADEDKHIIVLQVAKLTDAVISYAPCLEGFSKDLQAPLSWSVNLQYISDFLHFLKSSSESVVSADAITPKACGRGSKVTFAGLSEHSDMLIGINDTKDTIKNVLASPRLTPVKNGDSKSEDNDLYLDLVKAVDQLEKLSEKYQECQELWSEKEAVLTSHIDDLENQVHKHATNLELEQALRHRVTTIVLANIQRRRHCTVLRKAFQTWCSQAKLKKHLSIVKDMAKELLQTRKKVLLLKTHFDGPDS